MSRRDRLAKLETAEHKQKSVFVVKGSSDEEHQRQIDEAIACGKAAPDSLFVYTKKFPCSTPRGLIEAACIGHHHVLVADRAKVFQGASAPAGMRILYAILESSGQLTHLRDFDTHAPHRFDVGTVIMFRGDREFDHMEIERAGFVTDMGATTLARHDATT